MNRLKELRASDLRRINGLTRKMVAAPDWSPLANICIQKLPTIVSIDYVAWNTFNHDRTRVLEVMGTPDVVTRATELLDEVNTYLPDWHPILSTVGWSAVEKKLATMSDFKPVGLFRSTPLYREAYRHLEADFQAAESIGCYGDINLTMSYNRSMRDFTRREREILHLINRRLDIVAGALHRRQRLRQNLDRLTALAGVGKLPTEKLTPTEIHAIASCLRNASVYPDTKARLREKLGAETAKQIPAIILDGLSRQRRLNRQQ